MIAHARNERVSSRPGRLGVVLSLTVAVTGCFGGSSSPPPPPTIPVVGTVTWNGQPLSNASIIFLPRAETAGQECSGITDANGRFELKHPLGAVGAPPGEYSVVVSRLVDSKGQPITPDPNVPPADLGAVESLPPKYSDVTQTTLTATVPKPDGEFVFDLKGK